MKTFRQFVSESVPPTKKFRKFHGNYCGPGNQGGKPVDKLDRACMRHDSQYHKAKSLDKNKAAELRKKADHHFAKRADRVASDKSHPLSTRVKAKMASAYFKTKNIGSNHA